MADAQTMRFYAGAAKTYAAHTSEQPDPQMRDFVTALPAGAHVLELGSGGGRDAAFMLAQGLDVHPTDASAELAAEAARRIGRPVTIMAFDQLDAEAAYDGVWASASLLHAPKDELTADLGRIHRALRPGGLLIASFKAGNGEGRDQFGRYYNYPDRITLQGHFQAAAAWQRLDITARAGSGYDRLPTTWLWVSARKSA